MTVTFEDVELDRLVARLRLHLKTKSRRVLTKSRAEVGRKAQELMAAGHWRGREAALRGVMELIYEADRELALPASMSRVLQNVRRALGTALSA